MRADWVARPRSPAAERLAGAGHNRYVAELLAQRGVADEAAALRFLTPSFADLHDPRELAGLEEAADRIESAGASGRGIVVVGDYDVDGITSTALLIGTLQALGLTAEAILPSRRAGGYGLQPRHVERAVARGAALLVTADCGTSAHEALAAARAAGLPVVVTDHHLPGDRPPDAAALINPKQEGCSYPFRELCAAGLAMKLAAELFRRRKREPPWEALLRIAALGTIADAVPLEGENRAIAALGLEALPRTPSPGLRALLARAQVRAPLSATDVAFRLGPRLNAPGRIADPDPSLELLLTRDPARAAALADELEAANRRRQELEREVLEDCARLLDEDRDAGGAPIFVAWSERWHKGVVGIAAGRLARELGRPAILFAVEPDGIATGSGRSVEGVDLHALLQPCANELLRFGGHAQAVGLTAELSRLPAARERFLAAAHAVPAAAADSRRTRYDLELPAAGVTLELARAVARLEPFGTANAEPLFRVGALALAGAPRRFGASHLGFEAAGESGGRFEVVAWKWGERDGPWRERFELLGALEVDRRARPERVRLRLVDARPAPEGPPG